MADLGTRDILRQPGFLVGNPLSTFQGAVGSALNENRDLPWVGTHSQVQQTSGHFLLRLKPGGFRGDEQGSLFS